MFVKPSSSLVGHRHPIIVKDSYVGSTLSRSSRWSSGVRVLISQSSRQWIIFRLHDVNDITSPTMRPRTRSTTAPFTPPPNNPRRYFVTGHYPGPHWPKVSHLGSGRVAHQLRRNHLRGLSEAGVNGAVVERVSALIVGEVMSLTIV